MRKAFLLFVILFTALQASAQKKQNIYFLKNSGKEVSLKDSADYIRVIEEPDSGEIFFNIKEFYPNGKPKLLGKVSSFEPTIVYEGVVASYYKNGAKKNLITYKKDIPVGMAYYFFEDGKLKKHVEYPENVAKEAELDRRFKLIYQVDSLGKVYVKDGNGHLIERDSEGKDTLIVEGDYKDGFKDGVWKGRYTSGKSSYTEEYTLSKFVSGTQTVGEKVYEYTVLEKAPQFKGGVNEFYKFLGRSVKYPRDAFSNNISGNVVVSFVVEKDGKITDAKIVRSVYPSIDTEALRVVLASPNWIPGFQRGVPVRVKYNIPIKFDAR